MPFRPGTKVCESKQGCLVVGVPIIQSQVNTIPVKPSTTINGKPYSRNPSDYCAMASPNIMHDLTHVHMGQVYSLDNAML